MHLKLIKYFIFLCQSILNLTYKYIYSFQYITPTDGNDEFIYSYNPCVGYNEGDSGNCNGVSVSHHQI